MQHSQLVDLDPDVQMQSPWTNSFRCFSTVICYHTASFPGKRIVNKRLQTSMIITLAPVMF